MKLRRLLSAPLLAAPFRPFFLLGVPFGIGAMVAAFFVGDVAVHGHALRHGHEMIFGFAGAIVSGVVLTALPTWAGTAEIKGGRLLFLVALWLAGRFVMLPGMPAGGLALLADCALFPAMAAMLAPQLLGVRNKWYLLALPGLLGLAIANLLFHLAADAQGAVVGLKLAVYVLMVFYLLKSGVFIPVFISNVLLERGRGAPLERHLVLELASAGLLAALAAADLTQAGAAWVGGLGLLACLCNAVRLLRWRGWRAWDEPVVTAMQLGIFFLVAALGMRAGAALSPAVPAAAWLHVFTVGGLGMCMIALMTRIVLKHTGRPLRLPPAIRLAYLLMLAAALARVAWGLQPTTQWLLPASTLLWIASFAIYLALFGTMFWKPSLPPLAKPALKSATV